MLTDAEEDYAQGFVPFLGVTVRLDSRPLVPRTETEYWTEKLLHTLSSTTSYSILDLFTGSGAVGLALLTHLPQCRVTFVDIEPRHFTTIQQSVAENGIDSSRATYVASDVWESVRGMFNVVAANPPYISRERNTVDESVRAAEPHEALFAEDDGFSLIQKTLEGLASHLTPDGSLWIEHEPYQSERLWALATLHGFKTSTRGDQYDVQRFSILSRAD